MMKTLVVTCLPGLDQSWTGKALQAFLDQAKLDDVECEDLCVEEPSYMTPAMLASYKKRNYGGETLLPEEAMAIEQADIVCDQLCSCDILVMAFPMYNFSIPAAVKAWFDMVMQFGKTWTIDPGNNYRGTVPCKKALVFMASGGTYLTEPAKSLDHAEPFVRMLLNFLGIADVEFIRVQGTAGRPENVEANLKAASEKAAELARNIYKA